MAWKFVPGTGMLNVPDPIDKSMVIQDRVTNAERASQLPDGKQNQRYVDDGVRKYLLADIEAEVQDAVKLVKHELIGSHEHDELAANDVDIAEQFDENGNSSVDELAPDDVEYKEELDENGNPIADEINEVDLQLGIDGKSLVKGDEAIVPSMQIKGTIVAIDSDFVILRHEGRLKSFCIDQVMPVAEESV